MELASQIDELIDVVTSCTKATFDRDAYIAMIQQSYLPPASLGYLRRHWISQECVKRSATWFGKIAEKLGVNLGDLREVHIARAGFVLAFLLLKHVLEYEYIELPGDVKSRIHATAIDLVSLDVAVGHVWPIVISIGVDALYVLKPLREQIERGGLRLIKRLVAPLAVFGVVSDILHTSGMTGNYFTATGFGKLVNRLIDVVLENKISVDLQEVAKSLTAASQVYALMFQDPLSPRRDWIGFAKWLSKKYNELGGSPSLYTVEDVALDMAHLVLTIADHYRDVEARRLLHRMHRAVNDAQELVVRWLFARLVRIW